MSMLVIVPHGKDTLKVVHRANLIVYHSGENEPHFLLFSAFPNILYTIFLTTY